MSDNKYILTQDERDTLDAAMDIILARTPEDASWSFGANHWHQEPGMSPSAYFSSGRVQHPIFDAGNKLSQHVQAGLYFQKYEDEENSAKNQRIAELRAELAKLTGESEEEDKA